VSRSGESWRLVIDGDLVAVVVLDYLDVPGYGAYLRGDVAGFEKGVAEALIQQRRVRRFQEVPPTTPAPSANTPPEQAAKLLVAEPTTLATLPKPVPAVAASSPRAREAAATAYLERALFEPRPWNPASWAKTVPVVTALSPRLAAAVAFLREVLRTPRPATEVLTLAGQRGISRATLRRAKQALRVVKAQKVAMRAGWVWVIRDGSSGGEHLRAHTHRKTLNG
jgi:hypothetical protein